MDIRATLKEIALQVQAEGGVFSSCYVPPADDDCSINTIGHGYDVAVAIINMAVEAQIPPQIMILGLMMGGLPAEDVLRAKCEAQGIDPLDSEILSEA